MKNEENPDDKCFIKANSLMNEFKLVLLIILIKGHSSGVNFNTSGYRIRKYFNLRNVK